jgi:hypothetical protein
VVDGFEGADFERWRGGDVEVIEWFDGVIGILLVFRF